MFEKSLYDLIRGLRNHKGNEREYIQRSLRECRAEIRGPDMDLKATALLKLIYLEMFGHDMSWASFNVLEVMSSPKYLQKRVGYLGAVQSFRPNTEVLMLATNLLKKDINSPSIPTICLPLITLPHITTPSIAMSLLTDLLPRLSHSNPSIRKKTIVALYRLALAYPETLRHAWPKIKEMLMNEDEDPSVTAAVINVVCELGWRRPRDFLPLAPRLFDLLIDGGNNWMAIKIIKLFATLTPLEPRLIKKLLPPLMTLIQTTPAMSLLYECVNGIIQGGILEGTDGAHEGEEVAAVCVGKLRGMIASEGDPNLKYVALLAFNKIVISHPHVVATHQDMIMNCIDDPDVSIRLQALNLGSGMVNVENLISVVDGLMQQLRKAALQNRSSFAEEVNQNSKVEAAADSDDQDPEETLRPTKPHKDDIPHVPEEYKIAVIHQILNMCSRNTYAYITDFEWYIRALVDLVRLIPVTTIPTGGPSILTERPDDRISAAVGAELRNVAVRVSAVRSDAVNASDSLLAAAGSQDFTSKLGAGGQGVLQYAAWIVGEYAESLLSPHDTLDSLMQPTVQTLGPEVIIAYLQAIPKIFVSIVSSHEFSWTQQSRTIISLLLAKIIHFFEPFTAHPNLEAQERSVELLELMRLAEEAILKHSREDHDGPLLVTKAIPCLFRGLELNPVAVSAQRKVPAPASLDLDIPLNENLSILLQHAEREAPQDTESIETEHFYYQRPAKKIVQESIAKFLLRPFDDPSSYQHEEGSLPDASVVARKRAERRERNKDDPFYIGNINDSSSGTSTPFHDILKKSNGTDVDIDSIPIMDLDLGGNFTSADARNVERTERKRKHHQKIHITADEYIGNDIVEDPIKSNKVTAAQSKTDAMQGKGKKSLLQIDSSGIGKLGLNQKKEEGMHEQLDVYKKDMEDAEMANALAEVERLRLEMQRASERIQVAEDIPVDGTLVKKKRKKKKTSAVITEDTGVEGRVKARGGSPATNEEVVSRKLKKKRMIKTVHTSQELPER